MNFESYIFLKDVVIYQIILYLMENDLVLRTKEDGHIVFLLLSKICLMTLLYIKKFSFDHFLTLTFLA